MAEQWRPVPGFEGLYEVSDLGRVFSLVSRKALKPRPTNAMGYMSLQLYREGRAHGRRIHRLVLEAFVGPCPAGSEGRHLDGQPDRNCLSNLSWGTRAENQRDRREHGTGHAITCRKAAAHPQTTLTEDDVRCILAEPSWPGVARMLATAFDVSRHAIHSIRRRRRWASLQLPTI